MKPGTFGGLCIAESGLLMLPMVAGVQSYGWRAVNLPGRLKVRHVHPSPAGPSSTGAIDVIAANLVTEVGITLLTGLQSRIVNAPSLIGIPAISVRVGIGWLGWNLPVLESRPGNAIELIAFHTRCRSGNRRRLT